MTMLMRNTKRAFNGDEAFAQAFVTGMDKHFEMDSVQPMSYRTCAIGCNVRVVNEHLGTKLLRDDHRGLADAIGVPEQLLWQQDVIFEGLPSNYRRAFPRDFAHDLAECRDITFVWQRQMLWLLQEEMALFRCNEIDRVAALYERWVGGDRPSDDEFSLVIDAARGGGTSQCDNLHVLYVTRFAANAVFLPSSAGRAASEVAIAWRSVFEDGPPNNTSYQRQRDNLLKLLRGAGR